MPNTDDLIKNVRYLAETWRKDNGYLGRGGVVVVCGAEAVGWVNKLRNPEHWVPDCIAVDELGVCHEAIGGDAYKGAKQWVLLTSEPQQKIAQG